MTRVEIEMLFTDDSRTNALCIYMQTFQCWCQKWCSHYHGRLSELLFKNNNESRVHMTPQHGYVIVSITWDWNTSSPAK